MEWNELISKIEKLREKKEEVKIITDEVAKEILKEDEFKYLIRCDELFQLLRFLLK